MPLAASGVAGKQSGNNEIGAASRSVSLCRGELDAERDEDDAGHLVDPLAHARRRRSRILGVVKNSETPTNQAIRHHGHDDAIDEFHRDRRIVALTTVENIDRKKKTALGFSALATKPRKAADGRSARSLRPS
jgi:hypothetical protein